MFRYKIQVSMHFLIFLDITLQCIKNSKSKVVKFKLLIAYFSYTSGYDLHTG